MRGAAEGDAKIYLKAGAPRGNSEGVVYVAFESARGRDPCVEMLDFYFTILE